MNMVVSYTDILSELPFLYVIPSITRVATSCKRYISLYSHLQDEVHFYFTKSNPSSNVSAQHEHPEYLNAQGMP